jgi:GMP synthase (glutamine-hydrolysing)
MSEERNRVILEHTTSSRNGITPPNQSLSLCFLGCEENPPYGPTEHTAQLFLDLIVRTLTEKYPEVSWLVKITVFRVQHFDYPSSYREFDGVLLPGSFSGAYEKSEWIQRLKEVIQRDIYENSIPTFGVCFGHQIFAHALEGGKATTCPAGPQAGRKVLFAARGEGASLLSQDEYHLLYTHGDMVATLPSCAKSLGGNSNVPVLCAIYYDTKTKTKPVAVTFQAHPEYAANYTLGIKVTFERILAKMEERGALSSDDRRKVQEDAQARFYQVERHSLDAMAMVGEQLGWFP